MSEKKIRKWPRSRVEAIQFGLRVLKNGEKVQQEACSGIRRFVDFVAIIGA